MLGKRANPVILIVLTALSILMLWARMITRNHTGDHGRTGRRAGGISGGVVIQGHAEQGVLPSQVLLMVT